MSVEYLARQRRRREKLQLSCYPCRKRKVRCDRNKPCENCTRRGEASGCTYAAATTSAVNTSRPSQSDNVQDRIGRLENVVGSLVQELKSPVANRTTVDIPSPSDTTQQPIENPVGRMQVKQNETNYVGSEHWAAIADNLPGGQKTNGEQSSQLPDLLLGLRTGSTVKNMLASVPPKNEVDRLISKYFNSLDLAELVTHAPTFQKEYENFWNSPTTVSFNWLSILFSMMCLATDILVQCGEQVPRDASKPQESVILFRQCSAQCLILSDYTKPNNYTVDALLLYFFCEILRFHDTHFGLYLVLSMIVRVAMRMGYHRDPSHYPNISIFAGELRRRVWALLVQLDVLVSLQIGLPRLIHEHDSDTASPRNIPKEDMDPEMTILPPSRPESSGAVLSYMIARMRLMSVLGRIHGHVTSIHPLSYDTVIHLHGQLNTQYNTLPSSMKVQKHPSVTDSAAVVMRRLSLDLLFRKALCVLHRRYMKPQNHLSWETCIEAALKIIHHQSFVYRESQPGGPLRGHLWKITCVATYDFLIAIMILCLALHSGFGSESESSSALDRDPNRQHPEALLSALKESYAIWAEWSSEMKESRQVVEIVKIMLDRVKEDDLTSLVRHPNNGTENLQVIQNSSYSDVDLSSTGDGIFPFSTPSDPSNAMNMRLPLSLLAGDIAEATSSCLGGIFDPMDDFDWALWDSHLQENGIYSQISSSNHMF